MSLNYKNFLILALISVLPPLLIWLPFFFRLESVWGIPLPKEGMQTIVANYDGPLYIVTAKSLYDPEIINDFQFNLPSGYYAAHFPLYPLLIRVFAGFFGYPYSMLFVTLASSILAIYFFSKFIADYVKKSELFWITLVFALFPARWLIVRSVGSPEPLFIAAFIASVYYFKKEKYIWAGLWGAATQAVKSPGILLFIAYFLAIFLPNFKIAATSTFNKWLTSLNIKRIFTVLLIPLSLLMVFTFYYLRLSDFFAYFHSGDNIHIFFPPFQIFNYSQPWVGTFWLEEVLFVYLIALLGLVKLIKMKDSILAWVVGVFLVSLFFVSHRDIIRYSLPIIPFLYAAFADTIASKEFKIIMLVLIIPIFLFALSFISQNVMPVADWAPLL